MHSPHQQQGYLVTLLINKYILSFHPFGPEKEQNHYVKFTDTRHGSCQRLVSSRQLLPDIGIQMFAGNFQQPCVRMNLFDYTHA